MTCLFRVFFAPSPERATNNGGRGPVGRLVEKRSDFLDVFTEGPRTKRDLVDDLGHSRSTVNRAVRELEVGSLIVRTDGRYAITHRGRHLLQSYRDTLAAFERIEEAEVALAELPADAPPGRGRRAQQPRDPLGDPRRP
jgi:DNA-binding MarR family transcriptional regulator